MAGGEHPHQNQAPSTPFSQYIITKKKNKTQGQQVLNIDLSIDIGNLSPDDDPLHTTSDLHPGKRSPLSL